MEAVVALDIKYRDFHERIYERLRKSGEEKSCGETYLCPDGEHQCETRQVCSSYVSFYIVSPNYFHIAYQVLTVLSRSAQVVCSFTVDLYLQQEGNSQ